MVLTLRNGDETHDPLPPPHPRMGPPRVVAGRAGCVRRGAGAGAVSKPADTFHIAFDTKDTPGLLKCTVVSLRTEYVADEKRSFRVDLAAHPLYPALAEYVFNNPPAGVAVRRQKA